MGHDADAGDPGRDLNRRQGSGLTWATIWARSNPANMPTSSPWTGDPIANVAELEHVRFVMKAGRGLPPGRRTGRALGLSYFFFVGWKSEASSTTGAMNWWKALRFSTLRLTPLQIRQHEQADRARQAAVAADIDFGDQRGRNGRCRASRRHPSEGSPEFRFQADRGRMAGDADRVFLKRQRPVSSVPL